MVRSEHQRTWSDLNINEHPFQINSVYGVNVNWGPATVYSVRLTLYSVTLTVYIVKLTMVYNLGFELRNLLVSEIRTHHVRITKLYLQETPHGQQYCQDSSSCGKIENRNFITSGNNHEHLFNNPNTKWRVLN